MKKDEIKSEIYKICEKYGKGSAEVEIENGEVKLFFRTRTDENFIEELKKIENAAGMEIKLIDLEKIN
ncbi:MAG: hypothetical protein K9G67_11840 [Bacteroidales bacterium]|nr:hypothetical protein [Bacteroidales bacterium]MCF8352001.1 hypothetical protein [Bacteroidales bacterium]MCF8377040.1 hypothetical protein [Bacteroidales bacterium]MCF8400881.1 hypothetical protein [Bacteroidales bacterium]